MVSKDFAWIARDVTTSDLMALNDLRKVVLNDNEKCSPVIFGDHSWSLRMVEYMRSWYPELDVIPFARRLDYDGVVCFVNKDGPFPRGTVLILHWDNRLDTGVDEQHSSIQAWVETTKTEIDERRAEQGIGGREAE